MGQPCSRFPANQSGNPGAFSRLKSRLARRTGRNEALPAGPAEPFPSPSLPLTSHPFPGGPPSLQAPICVQRLLGCSPPGFLLPGGQRSLPEFLSSGFAFHCRMSHPKVSPPFRISACLEFCIPMTLHLLSSIPESLCPQSLHARAPVLRGDGWR